MYVSKMEACDCGEWATMADRMVGWWLVCLFIFWGRGFVSGGVFGCLERDVDLCMGGGMREIHVDVGSADYYAVC